ncbi:MAG: TIGR00645 family protein [Betaproteobacteria bacterium]|nr:TIGR00645 family protein [Betaproteobacteria bacterium]
MTPVARPRLGPISALIFTSRWLQLPLYVGLILAQAVYVYMFARECWHLVSHAPTLKEQEIMLIVLGLIDVVMISNLLIMVIIGGYETFVSRLNLQGHPDEPEWLSHVNASVLKLKLATAIIAISSIHLLRTFIDAPQLSTHQIMWQTIIHTVFLFSALAMAAVERIMPARGEGGH